MASEGHIARYYGRILWPQKGILEPALPNMPARYSDQGDSRLAVGRPASSALRSHQHELASIVLIQLTYCENHEDNVH